MSAEMSKPYQRPDLPSYCLGMVATGKCTLVKCRGLQKVNVADSMLQDFELAFKDAGHFCPMYQTTTPDGRVYDKPASEINPDIF